MKWFKRINSGEIKNRVIKKQSLKGAILFVVGTLTKSFGMQHYYKVDLSTGIVTATKLNVRSGPRNKL